MKILNLLLTVLLLSSTLIAQEWEEAAEFIGNRPERHHPVTFSLNGYGYVATGVDGFNNFYNDFHRYDPVADEWEKLDDFPGFSRGFAYGDTANGKAYLGFGAAQSGTALSDLWEYDPETEAWTQLTPCPGEGRYHPAFVAEGNNIVVGMGNNNDGDFNDFWMYDIAADTWEQMPDVPGPERHHPFYFGIDGTVYAGLGHGGPVIYRDWYSWKLGESTEWTVHKLFPGEARVAGTQFAYKGKGYVLSGQGSDHQNLDTGEFWEYEPSDDSWTRMPEDHPGSGRWAPGSFLLNDRIYIYGGRANTPGNPLDRFVTSDMWYYQFPVSSVEEFSTESTAAFPNPAYGEVSFTDADGIGDYRVASSLGETVLRGQNGTTDLTLDIGNLSLGTYLVYYKTVTGKVKTSRFVKN